MRWTLLLTLLVGLMPDRPATRRVAPAATPLGGSGSTSVALSALGDLLVFDSDADGLVAGDANGRADVFAWHRERGLQAVSVSTDEVSGDGPSGQAAVSADGRWVVFTSFARTLNPGDVAIWADVFMRDLDEQTTTCLSRGVGDATGDGNSGHPTVDDAGRLVAYQSFAENLVPADDNGRADIFLHDRATESTERLSVGFDGASGDGHSLRPALSGDGRVLAFTSEASNLVVDDANDVTDVFVMELATRTVERVNVSTDGEAADAGAGPAATVSLSRDGRYVVFASRAGNLVAGIDDALTERIYLRDRQLRTTTLVSVNDAGMPADDRCFSPSISHDGRFIAFQSLARNLAGNDADAFHDIFVHDRSTDTTRRLSVPVVKPVVPSGALRLGGDSWRPVLSGNGRYVAFISDDARLVPEDVDQVSDVFLVRL